MPQREASQPGTSSGLACAARASSSDPAAPHVMLQRAALRPTRVAMRPPRVMVTITTLHAA
jgi:hypothetical protein